jgi:hypothetical protein
MPPSIFEGPATTRITDLSSAEIAPSSLSPSADCRFLIANIALWWRTLARLAKPKSAYFTATRRIALAITNAIAVGYAFLWSIGFPILLCGTGILEEIAS